MRKQLIIWIVVLLVIAASFVLPSLMLKLEQNRMEARILAYDSGTILSFEALPLSDKQNLLSNYSANIVKEDYDNPEKKSRLISSFQKELLVLLEYGAIQPELYELMGQSFSDSVVSLCTAFDSSGTMSFRFYELASHDGFFYAQYDGELGKILSLGAYNGYKSIHDDSKGQDNVLEAELEMQLRSWAEYYEMEIGYVEPIGPVMDLDDTVTVLRCRMKDENGSGFDFAFQFNEYRFSWAWVSVSSLPSLGTDDPEMAEVEE